MSGIINPSKRRGKIFRVKCLKCGSETHIPKEGNKNFDKQVDKLVNTPCLGGPKGDGKDIVGKPLKEKCGGRMKLDKRIRFGM
tara:strand:- start:425 stop:673 length:249 start_codon:yes stop_codon:yes gene_type:complete